MDDTFDSTVQVRNNVEENDEEHQSFDTNYPQFGINMNNIEQHQLFDANDIDPYDDFNMHPSNDPSGEIIYQRRPPPSVDDMDKQLDWVIYFNLRFIFYFSKQMVWFSINRKEIQW